MAAKVSVPRSRFDLGQNADINVTPFVDVMLVLLIIFMVAAPLATRAHRIDAPPAGENTTSTKPVYVSVGVGGVIHIVDIKSSLSALPVDLADAIRMSNPGIAKPTAERVMIRADRGVAYRDFMGVLNVLRAAGYQKVGLISEAV